MPTTVLWLRRDLRLRDHPALACAAATGSVVVLFVLDDALLRPAGAARRTFLFRTLRSLDAELRTHGGGLVVRHGDPSRVVPAVAREVGADAVHITADFGPYGAVRDRRVEAELASIPLVRTGSPYAVSPGRVVKADGSPYRVFSAFHRAWADHGWPRPAAADPAEVQWVVARSEPLPPDPHVDASLPTAGEAAAHAAWASFRRGGLGSYPSGRDRPALDSTSRLSPYLRFGSIHPRTLLADLGPNDRVFAKELAWRDFYATVLHFWPASAREYFRPELVGMRYDRGSRADERFTAWTEGRTGYPLVDAGMRQLRREAWMHNRLRMLTASFLVKDLHLQWPRGARHFMTHLVDGDLASNQHGWQWVAGTGTDAAPYFRVFNPVRQSERFDPDGSFIRRWIPELSTVPTVDLHAPWRRGTPPGGYPGPIVDHDVERQESLTRYQEARSR
ncbi:MAG TPA: deoxyribodipyrimidine photo-lyase [Candidatus Nanopelagicales bacterium]|nr:deoxyribodipyrimidine photo-lyase [Candidatus Nanopelagicales bacterium]